MRDSSDWSFYPIATWELLKVFEQVSVTIQSDDCYPNKVQMEEGQAWKESNHRICTSKHT